MGTCHEPISQTLLTTLLSFSRSNLLAPQGIGYELWISKYATNRLCPETISYGLCVLLLPGVTK